MLEQQSRQNFFEDSADFEITARALLRDLKFANYQWTGTAAANISVMGFPAWTIAGTSSSIAPTGTEPGYLRTTSAAAVNTSIAIQQGSRNYPRGAVNAIRFRSRINPALPNGRYWFGFYDAGALAALRSENPASNVMMFKFSRGIDTTWQCYCATSAVAFTQVDSGVVPDSNGHVFEILPRGSAVRFFIDDVLVASIPTNLPPVGTLCDITMAGDTQATAAAITVDFSWLVMQAL